MSGVVTSIADVNGKINEASLDKFSELSKDAKIAFVENELEDLLVYVNQQIELCDEQASRVKNFSRATFEAKKMLIEQKVSILKQLFSIQKEQKDDEDIGSLTDLLTQKLK